MPRAGEVVDIKVRLTSTGTVRGRFLMPDGLTAIPYGVVKLTAGGRADRPDHDRWVRATSAASASTTCPRARRASTPKTRSRAAPAWRWARSKTTARCWTWTCCAQALGTVEGVVTSNGLPQAAASVEVVSGAYRASTLADGAGRYLVRGVPAGRVVATASLSGGFLQGTASGNLDGRRLDPVLDVALRGSGQVTGQVLAADGVTPAAALGSPPYRRRRRAAALSPPSPRPRVGSHSTASPRAKRPSMPTWSAASTQARPRPWSRAGAPSMSRSAYAASESSAAPPSTRRACPPPASSRVAVAGAPPLSLEVGNDGRFEWPEVAAGSLLRDPAGHVAGVHALRIGVGRSATRRGHRRQHPGSAERHRHRHRASARRHQPRVWGPGYGSPGERSAGRGAGPGRRALHRARGSARRAHRFRE